MLFTNNEMATYLFCAQLSQTRTPPLTILEWNAVVKSLGEHGLQPEVLQTMTPSELLKILTQATTSQKSKIVKKIETRQKLGFSMLELEEIVHQGYGIMFRSHMPQRVKKLTQKFLPAFFYYAGDLTILSHRALGVVGARDASAQELEQTTSIARDAVSHGVVIISGGARGVDTTAVEAALQTGGKAIVFPAEGLGKWVKKSAIREYIMNGQLLLMSTQRLEAPFSGSFAMQRNKYIHAIPDAVLVASSQISGTKSSGTWEGVLENIKLQWTPLYVIGDSKGVEKLKADGNAKQFTMFEDLYRPKNIGNLSASFEMKAKELIRISLDDGMDKDTIENMFKGVLDQHLKLDKPLAEKRLPGLEKQKEVEQLSIEGLLNHRGI